MPCSAWRSWRTEAWHRWSGGWGGTRRNPILDYLAAHHLPKGTGTGWLARNQVNEGGLIVHGASYASLTRPLYMKVKGRGPRM